MDIAGVPCKAATPQSTPLEGSSFLSKTGSRSESLLFQVQRRPPSLPAPAGPNVGSPRQTPLPPAPAEPNVCGSRHPPLLPALNHPFGHCEHPTCNRPPVHSAAIRTEVRGIVPVTRPKHSG